MVCQESLVVVMIPSLYHGLYRGAGVGGGLSGTGDGSDGGRRCSGPDCLWS